jgi:hypothetical protein
LVGAGREFASSAASIALESSEDLMKAGYSRRLSRLAGLPSCALLAALMAPSASSAQGINAPATKPASASKPAPAARASAAVTTTPLNGGGDYFIEFRSRYAWDWGHTFIVFGRVGQKIGPANVAGLSPKGDDPTTWMIGHFIPVPSDTGYTDGDLDDREITSKWRVTMNKAEYDKVMAYVRQLQASSPVWNLEVYNCNAFAGQIARYMGFRVPATSDTYPKVFIKNMREINTGHPDANIVAEHLEEMNNPTRDGNAMINNGTYARALTTPARAPTTTPATPGPKVIIGPVRVTNRETSPIASSEASP